MKPGAKFALVLLLVAVSVFCYKTFYVDDISTAEGIENMSNTIAEDLNFHKGVSVQIDTPVDGSLKAVVECGAEGLNAFIINLDSQGRWEKVKYRWGTSFVIDDFNSKTEILAAIKEYILWFINYGVNGSDIHFVISSGALKTDNGRELSQAISSAGYFVNEVQANEEGKYAFLSSVPRLYRNNSASEDIGSGNCKTTTEDQSCESPGAKFHKLNINPTVAIKQLSNCTRLLVGKDKVFIIGGFPYNMYKVHNVDERYVQLKKPSFYKQLADEGVKNQNGLLLYQTLWDNFDGEIIFDSHANMAIGFLIDLYS